MKIVIVDDDKDIGEILEIALVNEGYEVQPYKMLYEAIWKEEYLNNKGTIMVRVSSIRSKLPKLDIESVRGQGYRMIIR